VKHWLHSIISPCAVVSFPFGSRRLKSLLPSHNLTAGIFPIVAGGIVSHRTPLELHLGAVYCDHPVAPAPLDRDAHSEEAGIAADIYAVVPTIVL
jgi:hypothetical protein